MSNAELAGSRSDDDVARVRAAVGAVLGSAPQRDRYGGIRIVSAATIAAEAGDWCGVPVPLKSPEAPRSKALAKWFGESVVVDEGGKPLTVFHGTKAGDFTVFDIGRASASSRFGPGFYFTQDEKTLDVYGASGRVVPVYLRIARPQVGDALTAEQVEAFFEALQDKVFPNGFDATFAHEFARESALRDLDSAFSVLLSTQVCYISAADWIRGMDAMGVDGIIREVNGHPEYVVLHPEQIKSAVSNRGYFDPNSPDILHSHSDKLRWTPAGMSGKQIVPRLAGGALAKQGGSDVLAAQWQSERLAIYRALHVFDGEDRAVYAHSGAGSWKLLARTAQGQWFTQAFSANGPASRSLYADLESAKSALTRDGYDRPDDQAYDRLQGTPSFQRGLFASDVWRQIGAGEIPFSVGNLQLSDYDGHAAARMYVGAREAQAFYTPKDDTITLIADRIEPGREVAVLLHEIVHKHGPRTVGEAGMRRLVDGVKAWANSPMPSIERRIHDVASAKARAAAGPAGPVHDEELFAYAVEEAVAAGVRPTLEGREGSAEQWLGDVVATLRGAIFQITQGAAPALDAQQIVDLAYALAQMESPEHGPLIRKQLDAARQIAHEITPATSFTMDKHGDSD